MQSVIAQAKRIVVKVGSSLVTNDGKGLDHDAIARWAAQIAKLRGTGKEVVLVSSGGLGRELNPLLRAATLPGRSSPGMPNGRSDCAPLA